MVTGIEARWGLYDLEIWLNTVIGSYEWKEVETCGGKSMESRCSLVPRLWMIQWEKEKMEKICRKGAIMVEEICMNERWNHRNLLYSIL